MCSGMCPRTGGCLEPVPQQYTWLWYLRPPSTCELDASQKGLHSSPSLTHTPCSVTAALPIYSPPRIRAGPGVCPGTLSNDGESVPCTRGDKCVQFYLENKLVHRKMTGHERDHAPGWNAVQSQHVLRLCSPEQPGTLGGPHGPELRPTAPVTAVTMPQTGRVGETFSDPSPADGSASQALRHPSVKQIVKRQGRAEGSKLLE